MPTTNKRRNKDFKKKRTRHSFHAKNMNRIKELREAASEETPKEEVKEEDVAEETTEEVKEEEEEEELTKELKDPPKVP